MLLNVNELPELTFEPFQASHIWTFGADFFDFDMLSPLKYSGVKALFQPAEDTEQPGPDAPSDSLPMSGGSNAAPEVDLTNVTLTVDGVERTFGIVLPDDYDPEAVYPTIIALHGGGSWGTDPGAMARLTNFSNIDDAAQFIQVYPQAIGDTWGWSPTDSEYDDVAFFEELVEELTTNWSVDGDNVFAAGISAGGVMVQRLALEVPELFSGYAVVASNLLASLTAGAVTSEGDEPMIIFSGSADPLMPYDGLSGFRGATVMYGAEETADFWAEWNSSTMGEFIDLPDTADDGMTVTMREAVDGSVQHYVVEGGVHAWPGSLQPQSTQDIDASELMVTFFADHIF